MREIGDIETLDAALAHRRAVVLFHANWCPHCRVFKPVFDELAPGARGCDAFVAVLDDLDNPLWDKYSIDVVPTVIFFDDGKIVRRLDGRLGVGLDAKDFERAIDAAARAPSNTTKPGKR